MPSATIPAASPFSANSRSTGPSSARVWKTWRQQPGMLGLRTALVLPHQQHWHEDGTLEWLWPELERLDLPFATMAWRFLPVFTRIAERHPHLRLIIDHCGGVRPAKDDAAFATVPELERIARQLAQRGAESDRRAGLLHRALSVPQHP